MGLLDTVNPLLYGGTSGGWPAPPPDRKKQVWDEIAEQEAAENAAIEQRNAAGLTRSRISGLRFNERRDMFDMPFGLLDRSSPAITSALGPQGPGITTPLGAWPSSDDWTHGPPMPQKPEEAAPQPLAGTPAPQSPAFDQAALPPEATSTEGRLPQRQRPPLSMAPPAAEQPPPFRQAQGEVSAQAGPMRAAPMPTAPMSAAPMSAPGNPPGDDRLINGFKGFVGNIHNGLGTALLSGIGSLVTGERTDPGGIRAKANNATARALRAKGVDQDTIDAAILTPESGLMKQLFLQHFGPNQAQVLGDGYIRDPRSGQVSRAYQPDDKTPPSVLEYQYYLKTLPKGQQAMPYDVWSAVKARASATNISNNVDMNSGQTYDKQLSEGLGKAHVALATGVEDAQTRARDVAAMQGAIDAIQKNGGTIGGMGQQQVLDLQKSINAGAAAFGYAKPFSESDLSDKEFLTKFNRSMAGAQAKSAVGSRVTNFEMSNYLKANPGLDMSITGNQRLLGIQAQIEQRNIAVGNAIRMATAEAVAAGKRIDPMTVEKIIRDYDEQHHVHDPITGQDLTQSYALPEFQQGGSNAPMAQAHRENVAGMEKIIGGVRYYTKPDQPGKWFHD